MTITAYFHLHMILPNREIETNYENRTNPTCCWNNLTLSHTHNLTLSHTLSLSGANLNCLIELRQLCRLFYLFINSFQLKYCIAACTCKSCLLKNACYLRYLSFKACEVS